MFNISPSLGNEVKCAFLKDIDTVNIPMLPNVAFPTPKGSINATRTANARAANNPLSQ